MMLPVWGVAAAAGGGAVLFLALSTACICWQTRRRKERRRDAEVQQWRAQFKSPEHRTPRPPARPLDTMAPAAVATLMAPPQAFEEQDNMATLSVRKATLRAERPVSTRGANGNLELRQVNMALPAGPGAHADYGNESIVDSEPDLPGMAAGDDSEDEDESENGVTIQVPLADPSGPAAGEARGGLHDQSLVLQDAAGGHDTASTTDEPPTYFDFGANNINFVPPEKPRNVIGDAPAPRPATVFERQGDSSGGDTCTAGSPSAAQLYVDLNTDGLDAAPPVWDKDSPVAVGGKRAAGEAGSAAGSDVESDDIPKYVDPEPFQAELGGKGAGRKRKPLRREESLAGFAVLDEEADADHAYELPSARGQRAGPDRDSSGQADLYETDLKPVPMMRLDKPYLPVNRMQIPLMSRQQAQAVLLDKGLVEGSFLFRESKGVTILSIVAGYKVQHFNVEERRPGSKVDLGAQEFTRAHLERFVEHYSQQTDNFLPTVLKFYVEP